MSDDKAQALADRLHMWPLEEGETWKSRVFWTDTYPHSEGKPRTRINMHWDDKNTTTSLRAELRELADAVTHDCGCEENCDSLLRSCPYTKYPSLADDDGCWCGFGACCACLCGEDNGGDA